MLTRPILMVFLAASTACATGFAEDGVAADPGWRKYCEGDSCINRIVTFDDEGRFRGSALLRYAPAENPLMLIGLPTGVDLQAPMIWQFDEETVETVPYMICDERSCSAQAIVGSNHVELLRTEDHLLITGRLLSGELLNVQIDLDGFARAFELDPSLAEPIPALAAAEN